MITRTLIEDSVRSEMRGKSLSQSQLSFEQYLWEYRTSSSVPIVKAADVSSFGMTSSLLISPDILSSHFRLDGETSSSPLAPVGACRRNFGVFDRFG